MEDVGIKIAIKEGVQVGLKDLLNETREGEKGHLDGLRPRLSDSQEEGPCLLTNRKPNVLEGHKWKRLSNIHKMTSPKSKDFQRKLANQK